MGLLYRISLWRQFYTDMQLKYWRYNDIKYFDNPFCKKKYCSHSKGNFLQLLNQVPNTKTNFVILIYKYDGLQTDIERV